MQAWEGSRHGYMYAFMSLHVYACYVYVMHKGNRTISGCGEVVRAVGTVGFSDTIPCYVDGGHSHTNMHTYTRHTYPYTLSYIPDKPTHTTHSRHLYTHMHTHHIMHYLMHLHMNITLPIDMHSLVCYTYHATYTMSTHSFMHSFMHSYTC